VAVSLAFASNGVLMGAWAPRIPEVKAHLALSSASLGLALLAPAVGSLIALRFAGRWSARYGSARITMLTTVAFCALGWVPGLATNLPELWIALLAWGAGVGSMDVAMNSQGVTVEAYYRRPVLSGFHAAWSIGSFTGAVLGGLGAALRVPISLQQAVLGAVLVTVVVIASRALLADPPHTGATTAAAPGEPRRRRRPHLPAARLILLGISAIFALMSEGAVADWSGVLLRDHLHAHLGQVGYAFAAFSVTMTVGRLVGDRVVHALGRRRCMTVLSLVGATGLAAGLATNVLAGVVIGFALLGVGLSIMVPVLFSAAADGDGPSAPAIATVASLGYTGFLIGPTCIGLVAQAVSVPFALWLLPFFTLAGGALGVIAVRSTPVGE
jgi:MFS family permease